MKSANINISIYYPLVLLNFSILNYESNYMS